MTSHYLFENMIMNDFDFIQFNLLSFIFDLMGVSYFDILCIAYHVVDKISNMVVRKVLKVTIFVGEVY